MSDPSIGTREEEGSPLLKLKEEIVRRWEQLPPEHQAILLLVLLDRSVWSKWSVKAWIVLQREGDDTE